MKILIQDCREGGGEGKEIFNIGMCPSDLSRYALSEMTKNKL